MRECGRVGSLEWAVVGEPLVGQAVSGDRSVVCEEGSGTVLLAVADGLGHGPDAAGSAQRVEKVLSAHGGEELDTLLRRCHDALSGTRGAAVALARVDPRNSCVRLAGVGNVSTGVIGAIPGGVAWLATSSPAAGIVGDTMPPHIRSSRLPIRVGDLLVMTSDGVGADLAAHTRLRLSIDAIALALFKAAARTDRDDALVLVGRIRGPSL